MRLMVLTAVALALCAAGCQNRAQRQAAPSQTFVDLVSAVDDLPPSPQKDRVERLVGQLEGRVAAGTAAVRLGLDPDSLAGLARLGEMMTPAQLEIGFATDGKDWSGDGVDNGIELHLTPRDITGTAVKTPGRIEARLVSESVVGLGIAERELQNWSVSAEALRYTWNDSLFPGYILRLPWQGDAPDVSRALLRVRFLPLFGAPLAARKDVRINTAVPAPADAPAEPAPTPLPEIGPLPEAPEAQPEPDAQAAPATPAVDMPADSAPQATPEAPDSGEPQTILE